MKPLLEIAKAMSDPNRLRVLCVLRGRTLCACDITEMLGLAQATISRHMSILIQAGLVVGNKDGRWMHYRLPEKTDNPALAVIEALNWVQGHTEWTHQIKKDEMFISEHMRKNDLECSRGH